MMRVEQEYDVYAIDGGLRPICPRAHDFAVTELIVHAGKETRRLYPVAGGFAEWGDEESLEGESALVAAHGGAA